MTSIIRWVMIGVAAIMILSTAMCSMEQVEDGSVGLYKTYGAIDDETLEPGLHFVNPFTATVEEMNLQTLNWKSTTPTFTKDLQTADVSFTVAYRLDPSRVVQTRRRYGREGWANRIVTPVVQSSIKNVFAGYTAMQAVAKRPEIQNKITTELQRRLENSGVIIDGFELTNLDYSDQFEAAVERAQVATQNAVAARNQTVVVREQGEQTKIRAAAQAERIRVEAQAISANPQIIELRRIEKWQGHLCPPGTQTCIIGDSANGTMLSVGR